MVSVRAASRAAALVFALAFAGTPLPAVAQADGDDSSTQGSEAPPSVPSTPDLEPIPGPSDYTAPPPGIEAIEVTGERVSDANVQDQAQAISAFTGADLDRASIVNVDSLAFNVPGLHVGQSAQAPIITLRGIGTENASLTGEPGVAFHVDGINIGRPGAARVAFFDLETLDVKRGPQGLLGGKNSTSGSINLITRKPTDDYEASGDVLFGNYDRQRYRFNVNVPLNEYMAWRVALYQETRDGFLDNKYAGPSQDPFDADDKGFRTHLRVNPTDTVELLLSWNYFQQKGNGPQANPVPIPLHVLPQFGALPGDPVPPNGRTVDPSELPPGYEHILDDGRIDLQELPPTGYAIGCKQVINTVMPLAVVCHDDKLANSETIQGQVRQRIFTGRRRIGTSFGTTPYRLVQQIPPFLDVENRATRNFTNGVWTSTTFPVANIYNPGTENSDPRTVYLDQTPTQDNKYWGWSSHLTWDAPSLPVLGESQVRLLGGFQQTKGDIAADFDATDVTLSRYSANDEANQYSIEGQWSGTSFGERLEWQMSLFQLHERASRDLVAPPPDPTDGDTTTDQTTSNTSYGLALNATYNILDSLRFNIGNRWITDDKETWLLRTVPKGDQYTKYRGCTGIIKYNAVGGADDFARPNEDCSQKYRGTLWGTGLEWRPFGDDHLLYAKFDRGYKSGGFRASTVGRYLPEKIWAYAAGNKSEFFDQRLRVNFEGFFYNYQDLQIVVVDGLALRTENTDAKMYGWDFEGQLSPIDGLNLSAVVSFLKTRTVDYFSLDPANTNQWQARRLEMREEAEANYEEGRRDSEAFFATKNNCYISDFDQGLTTCGELGDSGGQDDFSGNELSRSPKWKYTLSADYEIPLGRFGSVTPRVQYTWQDDTYFRAFNRDFDEQEEYHLTDAKLTWNSPENVWSVEAFIQNIENEAPKQNILIGPRYFGSPALAWYGPPRFYGVMVGFRY